VIETASKSFIRILFDYRDFIVPLIVILFYPLFLILQWSPGLVLFGVLLVFYVPGSVIVRTLGPNEDAFELIERTVLIVWISFSVTGLMGMILNYLPWGITLETVFISDIIITVIFLITAYLRFQK
jgi:uncharacterized membrane protein